MKVAHISQYREFSSERFVSKLIHDSENSRVVLFCLDAGQEVPAHSSTSEVIFLVVGGKGTIQVGDAEVMVEAGNIVTCPPQALHGIKAGEKIEVLAVIAPRP